MINIAIGLCAFNNENGLPFVIQNLITIYKSNIFDHISIIFFYDTSIDNTLPILKKFKEWVNHQTFGERATTENINFFHEINRKSKMDVFIIENENNPGAFRTEKIAYARNCILKNLLERSAIKYDYFAMMDCNEYSCIGDINIETLSEVLERNEEWDSVSFIREAGHYDDWALSFDIHLYSFFHFLNWKDVVELMRRDYKIYMQRFSSSSSDQDFNVLAETESESKLNLSERSADKNCIGETGVNTPEISSCETKTEFIPVFSAFNGFAIYKFDKFIDCRYSSDIDIGLFPDNSIENQINYLKKNIVTLPKYHNLCALRSDKLTIDGDDGDGDNPLNFIKIMRKQLSNLKIAGRSKNERRLNILRSATKENSISLVLNKNNDCEHRHFHLESIKKHDSKIRIYNKSLFKKLVNPPPFNTRGPC